VTHTLNAADVAPYPRELEQATVTALIRHLLLSAEEISRKARESIPPPGESLLDSVMLSGLFVNTWSTMFLLRVIRAELPGQADDVARQLWDLWEDGGTMHELIWDYKQQEGIDPAARIEFDAEPVSDGGQT